MKKDTAGDWYRKGNNFLKLFGNYKEAINCYNKALELNSMHANAWFNKGEALFILKNYEKAVECYDRALALKNGPDVEVVENRRKIAQEAAEHEEHVETSKTISSIEFELTNVKTTGVKIPEADKELERAKVALNENNFIEARQLASLAKKTALDTKGTHYKAMSSISSATKQINATKSTEEDVSSAETLLNKAKNSFEDGNYEKTIDLANQAQKEAEKIAHEHEVYVETSVHISSIESKIKQIISTYSKKIGSYDLLKPAKKALDQRNFDEAKQLAEKAEQTALKLKDTADFISTIESEIANIKNSGVITSESDEVLKSAKDELSNNNFNRAKELTTKAKSRALQSKESYERALNSIALVDALINNAKTKGFIMSAPTQALKKARESIVEGKYHDAYNLAQEAEKVVNDSETKYREAKDQIKSALSAFKKTKDFGCPVSEAVELLNRANSAFNTGNYEETLVHTKKVEELAKKLRRESKPEIELELSEQSFKPNVWKPLNLILRNTGNAHAQGVKIDFSQEVEVKKLEEINLNAGEEKSLKIGFRPIQEGEIPLDTIINCRDFDNKEYTDETTFWITVGDKVEKKDELYMGIQIKRGYEVLQNNDLRLGIRVSNTAGYAINDVETILDYPRALFSLKDNLVQALAYIPPNGERTAKYVLTPLGCIHNEKIDATVVYKDHTGQRQAVQMRPKEVHCVCPFLKEKAMREGEFAEFATACESIEEGISFSGISVNEVVAFVKESCAHRLYVIGEHEIDTTKIVNLAGESIGEKAYYLLTAVIQPYKDFTQVAFRAYSDKPHGLHGFLSETSNSLRHLVRSVQSAKEIGIIENKQVITIIDSIVQRTSFGGLDVESAKQSETSVNIEGSLVQRTEIGSTRKCPNCGIDVKVTDKFCPECGTKLGEI